MNSINLHAREFIDINKCKNKYKYSLLDTITNEEMLNANTFINLKISNFYKNEKLTDENEQNNNAIKLKWLLNILNNCQIGKGQSWLEMQMPHTHSNVIIFNTRWFNSLSWGTFIHECVHIDQRIGLGISKYEELYYNWGFIKYNIINVKGMNDIVMKNRLNPDAVDCNWLWKCKEDNNVYWIGAVFNSITPYNLGDASYIGLKLYTGINGEYYYNGNEGKNLNNWKEYQNYFGIFNNHYHPNEIIAEYISIHLNNKSYLSQINTNLEQKKGYQTFIKWFNH